MKGIILAGGTGSRLDPMTRVVSKQMLPVYDKPMVFYPLATLLSAGVREILLITTPRDLHDYEDLLGDGREWGVQIDYAEQEEPRGIAEALLIGADHMAGSGCVLILGDNIFCWDGLVGALKSAMNRSGATLFGIEVSDPQRYGVIGFDGVGRVVSLVEKPQRPESKVAATGLYVFDASAVMRAKNLRPSPRGELEIMDLARSYMDGGALQVVRLPRGAAWFDAGTPDSLLDAAQYIHAVERRTGVKLGCPEEAALQAGLLTAQGIERLARGRASDYGRYLAGLVK